MAARTAVAAAELPGMMLGVRWVEGEVVAARQHACWGKVEAWAA